MDDAFMTELAQAMATHSPLPRFPSGITVEQAYAGQPAVSRKVGPTAGYKAGITNELIQRKLGLDQPLLGHLYRSGEQPGGAVLAHRPHAAIECELGIIVDAQGQPCWIVPALEFVHLRFTAPEDVSAANLVLCNLGADQFMLGQPQPWLSGLEALMESSTIRLFRDNQLIQQACALSSMNGPEEAGEWMLDQIRNHQWPVTEGTLLMTGTCGDAIPFQPGSYRADYGPLGQIEFSIAPV